MVNIITIAGCSRGFGRALVEAAFDNASISNPADPTTFILITSSKQNTIEMWNDVYHRKRGRHFADDTTSNIKVLVEEADLSCNNDLHRLGEVLRLMFYHIHDSIDSFYLFLNAGSVTPVGALTDPSVHDFEKALITHCMLNFVSFVLLTRALMRLTMAHKSRDGGVRIHIVNVSSIAAEQALYGMAVYSAIKSARDSIMKSLALEMQTDYSDIHVRILNYAPGPMDTKLVQEDLLGKGAPSNHLKQLKTKMFVDPLESAKKCIALLTVPESDRSWKNGEHIDFFDDVN